MPWLPLNVIRDNVNYWIMWSNWSRLTNPKSLYYYVYQSSLFVYCYHLVNSLFLSQSDHIKQFFLY
jgi:accessory colonization factor AcfC